MKKIITFFKRIYRISVNFEKQEKLVWKDMLKLHNESDWRSGIYEKERNIESVFTIAPGIPRVFYYQIYNWKYHCRVKILEEFPVELTTDAFILAAHFNNILNRGKVIVNVQLNYVEFHMDYDLSVPLLYPSTLYSELLDHHRLSQDMFAAFDRLISENEAPAIIIADLLKKHNEKNQNQGKGS